MNTFIYYIILINFTGFSIMGIDKYKAIKNHWRIKEKSLFLIALALGGIGILIGMITFHHKTKKKKFKYGIPFIILINIFIFNHILLTLS